MQKNAAEDLNLENKHYNSIVTAKIIVSANRKWVMDDNFLPLLNYFYWMK